ncbi:hypothetical protein [Agrococcus jejuensis]|uniref:Uncharacterized protein n=1 Tax=Agrococcus jejuensis TaxID=399736 RepID=A0A1G8BBK1_9MICO|nr:hypothetical protein [Agrococcus jejuensis]SDH30586.1 hypothetical protein SAMN04489720_0861 [Agrococcus jejuensis]
MSQPSAYPPAASFRPASGWQFGEQPPQPVARTVALPALTATVLVVAAYLVMVQGIVAVVTVSDAAPDAVVRTAFTWLAGGAALAVLFALPSRSLPLLVATGAIALVDAIAYVVLGAMGLTGAYDPAIVAVALLLSAAAAAIGVASVAASKASLMTPAIVLGALGVVAFYGISIVSPILVNGVVDQTLSTAGRTVPVAALAVAAGVLLHRTDGALGVLAGAVLGVFGLSLAIAPVVSAILGTPPAAGSIVVVVLRVALVLAAAALVVVQSRRR